MPNHFEDVYFAADTFDVRNVDNFLLLKDFYGHILLGLLMNSQLNLAKSSLSKGLFYIRIKSY